VEAALLLLAALGSALFAMADSLGALAGARAMVGLGVSACLMAALKGFTLWYPPERQSSMIGFIMASGSLGALTTTTNVAAGRDTKPHPRTQHRSTVTPRHAGSSHVGTIRSSSSSSPRSSDKAATQTHAHSARRHQI